MDLRTYLLASLGALTVIAGYVHGIGNVLPQTAIAVTTTAASDVALRSLMTGVRVFPTGGLISGFIVALLLPDGQPWYVPLTAAALASGSKHLLRWRGGNVFNPAAFGIAVSVLVFAGELYYDHAGYLEGAPRIYFAQERLRMGDFSFVLVDGHGWTGSTSTVAVVILGAVLVHRLRRMEIVASFLVTYVVLVAGFAGVTGQDAAVRLTLEVFASGIPFFTLFMLTDPATSPAKARSRTWYGVLVAVLAFLLRLVASPVQFLLYAILAANLVLSIHRGRARRTHLRPGRTVAAAGSRRHD